MEASFSEIQSQYLCYWTCSVNNIYYCLIIAYIIDVNECELGTDNCDQLCIDDLGSYHCGCYNGYLIDNDSSSCVG